MTLNKYKHPTHEFFSGEDDDTHYYRIHPNHAVRVTMVSGKQYYVKHVQYSSALLGRLDYDIPSTEALFTDVHSDITEFIDDIAERYLQPARLSELMMECM